MRELREFLANPKTQVLEKRVKAVMHPMGKREQVELEFASGYKHRSLQEGQHEGVKTLEVLRDSPLGTSGSEGQVFGDDVSGVFVAKEELLINKLLDNIVEVEDFFAKMSVELDTLKIQLLVEEFKSGVK